MLGALGAALMAVPDAVGLGVEAMGFSADAFRRVAAGDRARDLVVLVVYLAGISLGIGNGVVLFLNRVPPLRFALSLALTGAIHLVGALVTTATALFVAEVVVGRDLDFVPTLAVIALAQAPLLLGFLTLAPYFGELLERCLDVWVLMLVLYGLHQALGMTVQGAALLALLGWASTRVLTVALGRPLTRVVAALRRAVAGGPLTLDSRNLIETLKAEARSRESRRSGDR
jgi:hypothetical protein